MKRILLFSLLILSILKLAAQNEKKLLILHTNDLHSRITGYAPESLYTPLTTNDDNTSGGFARIATIIKNEKESFDGTTLVLDAGDFLMGTLFQAMETRNGFQLRLMKLMGYDVGCLGNHEFDYGPEKTAEIISRSAEGGEIPVLLLSNAVFDPEDSSDDALEKLFNSGIIKRKYVMERDGMKIGFFSLMGKVAADNAAFAKPVRFAGQKSVAKRMVRELKKEKCDIIICLSHSGVSKDKKGNIAGEDVKLAKKVKGINVIISGHTHTKLNSPVIVNGTVIVQAGEYGEYVGKLSLIYREGKTEADNYTLIPVDDRIAGDLEINDLVVNQKRLIDEEILIPAGMSYEKSIVETDFLLECDWEDDFAESNLGPLVADAIHSYINRNTKTGTDISLVAAGVIRDKILPGLQSASDIFRIMSMGSGNDDVPGYPLARLYVTGKELKRILEILQIAYKNAPENYCFYSGIRVNYDPDKGMLRKINRIDIVNPDGTMTNVDFSRKNTSLYSITANSYILEFVGIIKKMSFGLINVVPKDESGNPVTDMKKAVIDLDEIAEGVQEGKEWLALIEYFSMMKDLDGNGVPDIDPKYKTSIKTFFTGS
ncbi:MAG TPA: bifunctional UDP-sugar hydrolase/5'-nucleotidase [Bacteroidales bacterium]|jgi:5'-nucleotidase/UDP-sugar diphosphatase|nr:bifunctional UDP-sugar hydrolase/5'-nucleotidase [Bacteroidales bacterium]